MENPKIKNELVVIPSTPNQKGIENHKQIATHFKAAAKHHLDAAKHHEDGNHQKAAKSTIAAHGHASLAEKGQKRDVRHHVLNG